MSGANLSSIPTGSIASGTANYVVVRDGTGVLSEEATLNKSRGGFGEDVSTLLGGTGYLKSTAGVLSLETVSADLVDGAVTNAKIASDAAISRSKIASGTA